ncbi:tyrosinase-like, partial [Chiloscyllium plagiosum]|uniref:tyrosinase-like n=1 Tax=Chiloscyllium plagiosum TaxID=36176 RepID=UPI001CB7C952
MSLGLELACVLLILGTARAMIPIQCGTPAHVESGVCCPTFWGDGSPCGSASGRGVCQDVTGETPQERAERERVQRNSRDFRLWWPTYFFRRLCVCRGNFGGADCGECAHGWRGAWCQARHIVIRRDISALPLAQQRLFVQRLHQAKVTLSQRYVIYASRSYTPGSAMTFRRASVYDATSYLHYIASKNIGSTDSNFGHRSTGFLSWHRLYLIRLENEIRNMTGDQDFSIPIWNWAGKTHCDVCTNNLFGASLPDGHLSPGSIFSSWRVRRDVGTSEGGFGILASIDGLSLSLLYSKKFCDEVENQQSGFHQVCSPVPGGPIVRYNHNNELPTWSDVRSCLQMQAFDTPPYDTTATYSFRNMLE